MSNDTLVNAPGGPRPQSLVHEIPPGHKLVIEKDGTPNAVDGAGVKKAFPAPSAMAQEWIKNRTVGPGPATAPDAFVSVNVVLVGSVYFLGTATGPQLQSNGVPVTTDFWGWIPIAAEKTADGYIVGWKNSSGLYTVWNVDSGGNSLGSAIGAVTVTDASLVPYEQLFNQDFNHDGVIGPPPPPPQHQLGNGWQCFAQVNVDSPIVRFEAHFNVPTSPARYEFQTLFYFPCTAEHIGGTSLLQPVLQYGPAANGGGEGWYIGCWYLKDSQLFFTPAIKLDTTVILLQGEIGIAGDTAIIWFDGYPETLFTVTDPIFVQQNWAAMTVESYFPTDGTFDLVAGDCTMTVDLINTEASLITNVPITWIETDWLSGAKATVSNNGTATATVKLHTPNTSTGP